MQIPGNEFAWSGAQKFRADDRPDKFLQRKSVVAEEACQCDRRGRKDTEPTGRFFADKLPRQQEHARSNDQRQYRAKKLTQGKSEKNGFLVLSNLFWDFDFDIRSPLIFHKI